MGVGRLRMDQLMNVVQLIPPQEVESKPLSIKDETMGFDQVID